MFVLEELDYFKMVGGEDGKYLYEQGTVLAEI